MQTPPALAHVWFGGWLMTNCTEGQGIRLCMYVCVYVYVCVCTCGCVYIFHYTIHPFNMHFIVFTNPDFYALYPIYIHFFFLSLLLQSVTLCFSLPLFLSTLVPLHLNPVVPPPIRFPFHSSDIVTLYAPLPLSSTYSPSLRISSTYSASLLSPALCLPLFSSQNSEPTPLFFNLLPPTLPLSSSCLTNLTALPNTNS